MNSSIFLAFIAFIMFPSASRAFAPAARRAITARPCTVQPPIARRMSSSTSGEGGKTVVDICREKIEKSLETDNVIVKGAFDDPNGAHIAIEVVSEKFSGKRPVQRQQLVYKALWEELKDPGGIVHAVDSMICKAPDEA